MPTPSGIRMPLIMQIREAVNSGALQEPFTTQDLKNWIASQFIVKDDGEPYADSSIDAILSNSDIDNKPTSNRNSKMLLSRLNSEGNKEYKF
jgi:hypothetical protein